MTELIAFLRSRLDEDERVARAAIHEDVRARDAERLARFTPPGKQAGPGVWTRGGGHTPRAEDCRIEGDDITIYDEGGHSPEQAEHIARHDPARVLAEVESKRYIVEMQEPPRDNCGGHPDAYMPHGEYGSGYCRRWVEDNYILVRLALPYRDHPDYDAARWAP